MENSTKQHEMQTNLIKFTMGGTKQQELLRTAANVRTQDENEDDVVLIDELSLSNHNNNNNAIVVEQQQKVTRGGGVAGDALVVGATAVVGSVAVEDTCCAAAVSVAQNLISNGSTLSPPTCRHHVDQPAPLETTPDAGCLLAAAAASNFALVEGAGAAAICLTPPGGHTNSNRTSINNSTENLSYSSDNYYADELLVLQHTISADDLDIDDDEVDDDRNDVHDIDDDDDDDDAAEKLSIFSDDCVYAYRGDGADYELTLAGMQSRNHFVDDETDFLEMDFEPDPLSEVECGGVIALDGLDVCASLSPNTVAASTVAASAAIAANHTLQPLQKCALQSQSLLSKNFARIALHLDQIKADETPCVGGGASGSSITSSGGIGSNRRESVSFATPLEPLVLAANETLAQSLPTSLLATFGRETHEQQHAHASPSKITGAKPKRLSTFSTSSSTSSKTSSKSRSSVRSSFPTTNTTSGSGAGNSFDERSLSCNDFRCNNAATHNVAAVNAAGGCSSHMSVANNDETCLDCLEKEFLANTIGKAVDLSECPKCRKRRGGSCIIGFSTMYSSSADSRSLCHSGAKSTSLCYEFNGLPHDGGGGGGSDRFSPVTSDYRHFQRNAQRMANLQQQQHGMFNAHAATAQLAQKSEMIAGNVFDANASQPLPATCDTFNGKHFLKNVLTKKEIVTISTQHLDEATLVQALDKLHVPYNAELLKTHFHVTNAATDKCAKDFKQLIMHTSKQPCNYARIKRLIEMTTLGQVEAIFKKDPLITQPETVPLKVADILEQWTRTNNLSTLLDLERRYQEANVLGKIANIIRQAQQRCTPRRPLPEFIAIPQYYASGYLTLKRKKKC